MFIIRIRIYPKDRRTEGANVSKFTTKFQKKWNRPWWPQSEALKQQVTYLKFIWNLEFSSLKVVN